MADAALRRTLLADSLLLDARLRTRRREQQDATTLDRAGS
jgi:hypothetical protein